MLRYAFPLLLATTASADVTVAFVEGAPKDRFIVSQTSACDLGPMRLTIDLTGSNGQLIFDLAGGGAGVEVFQPFELVAGADAVTRLPTVVDGGRILVLESDGLAPDGSIIFTLDVDDTRGGREITVTGAEIAGATADVNGQMATFRDDAVAQISTSACTS